MQVPVVKNRLRFREADLSLSAKEHREPLFHSPPLLSFRRRESKMPPVPDGLTGTGGESLSIFLTFS